MKTDIEALAEKLWMYDFSTARSAFILRIEREHESVNNITTRMLTDGWEIVDTINEHLTDDGRHIAKVGMKKLALRPEVHATRLAEAMEQARKRDAAIAEQHSQPTPPSQPPTTCTSLIDGQFCGGNLIRAAVCPRCALGKSGVAATLTCDVCGHVTAIMRGDS